MKLTAAFTEESPKFDATLAEGEQSFTANMGNIQIVYNGEAGATFTPSVSEDGTISWTNDRKLPNPAPVNIRGRDGKDGVDGKDGYTPVKGKDYFDGTNGRDGYTPVKGTDYFTDADKAEMVAAVLAALPKYDGEVIPL